MISECASCPFLDWEILDCTHKKAVAERGHNRFALQVLETWEQPPPEWCPLRKPDEPS